MATRPQTAKPAAKPALKHPTPPAAKRAETPTAQKTDRKTAVVSLKRSIKTGAFIFCYKMDFAEKVKVIRSGLPARRVGELSSVMNMPKEAFMDALGLSRATIHRKVQREQTLSPEESERVMGIQTLIGQVEAMVGKESAPDFDAAKWLASWLTAPLPALGGATPASFLDTVEGQKYVGNLLEMAQSGAYA
jgi:putative toxin-antitoxin system antitoxin component (TIGR02293 family)